MMNILQVQDALKGMPMEQLIREMQMPSGQAPQFLVLSEITRRKKMEQEAQQPAPTTTVAQDAVTAAGVPQQGIAGIAQAMAPNSDVMQNTGIAQAMPQQLPSEPQMMAEGGYVRKMQDGGNIGIRPRLVVRGGVQYAQMPDGSLIPLSELGFDAADLAGAGMADLAPPSSGEPVYSGPIPTQADLDRNYRDEMLGMDIGRRQPVSPDVADFLPTLPGEADMPLRQYSAFRPIPEGIRTPVAQTAPEMPTLEAPRSLAQRYIGDPLRDIFQPVGEDLRAMGQPIGEELRAMGQPVGEAIRAALAPSEADVLATQEIPMNAMEQLYQTEAMRVGPPSRSPDVTIREPQGENSLPWWLQMDPEAEPGEALERLLFPGRDPEEIRERRRAEREGAGQEPMPAETLAGVPGTELVPPTLPAAPEVPVVGGAGGAGGAGGGTRSASAFEQEIMDMLAQRERAAEQNKWMALAQAGMALMASRQPTFGGALGEAGLAGVEQLQRGRSQYDKDRLELMTLLENTRLAREKLATPRAPRAMPPAVLTAFDNQIEAVQAALTDTLNPPTPSEEMRLTRQLADLQARAAAVQNAFFAQYGYALPAAAETSSGVYSTDDVRS